MVEVTTSSGAQIPSGHSRRYEPHAVTGRCSRDAGRPRAHRPRQIAAYGLPAYKISKHLRWKERDGYAWIDRQAAWHVSGPPPPGDPLLSPNERPGANDADGGYPLTCPSITMGWSTSFADMWAASGDSIDHLMHITGWMTYDMVASTPKPVASRSRSSRAPQPWRPCLSPPPTHSQLSNHPVQALGHPLGVC